MKQEDESRLLGFRFTKTSKRSLTFSWYCWRNFRNSYAIFYAKPHGLALPCKDFSNDMKDYVLGLGDYVLRRALSIK